MASFNYTDLIKQAEGAGYSGGIDLPNGTYDVAINTANASQTAAKDDQIGVHFSAMSGAGTVWLNQQLPDNSEKNAVRIAIFFDVMGSLGLSKEWFITNSPSMAQIAEHIKSLGPFRITKSIRKSSQGGEFAKIKVLGAATGEPDQVAAATGGRATLPTVQQPAPVPVAPATVDAPVAPAVPGTPTVPATASDAPARPW